MKNNFFSLNLLFNTEERYKKAFQSIKNKEPKYADFQIKNNKIIYKPTGSIVLQKNEIENRLKNLYENDPNVLNKGISTFYKYVCSKYINVTRAECQDFLIKQKEYQLLYNPHKVVNKPIIAKYPNQRWQIDLIDMLPQVSKNHKYRYIFNIVDVFSRKVWLFPLKKKESI